VLHIGSPKAAKDLQSKETKERQEKELKELQTQRGAAKL
jgi:hypothetical protein